MSEQSANWHQNSGTCRCWAEEVEVSAELRGRVRDHTILFLASDLSFRPFLSDDSLKGV